MVENHTRADHGQNRCVGAFQLTSRRLHLLAGLEDFEIVDAGDVGDVFQVDRQDLAIHRIDLRVPEGGSFAQAATIEASSNAAHRANAEFITVPTPFKLLLLRYAHH
jgi:hypothetical protein